MSRWADAEEGTSPRSSFHRISRYPSSARRFAASFSLNPAHDFLDGYVGGKPCDALVAM